MYVGNKILQYNTYVSADKKNRTNSYHINKNGYWEIYLKFLEDLIIFLTFYVMVCIFI